MNHRPRKRFGQNFLHDTQIIQSIVDAVHPQPSQHLVEIGPGQGAITEPLWQSGADMDVIELDRDLVARLQQLWAQRDRIRLHSADALSFDYASLIKGDEKLRVVGNLPYNISTPLLFHLLEFSNQIQDMHFMLQKEVVNRMAAQPDTKAYGRLSIMLQLRCQVQSLFDVAPECFDPPPKVISSVVRLIPRTEWLQPVEDISALDRLVSQAFSQRRKTIRNSLKTVCSVEDLEAVNIAPGARAENLTVLDFVALSHRLSHASD